MDDDPKIQAEGSIWKLYWLPGQTPTADRFLELTGAVKATIVAEPDHTALITPTQNHFAKMIATLDEGRV